MFIPLKGFIFLRIFCRREISGLYSEFLFSGTDTGTVPDKLELGQTSLNFSREAENKSVMQEVPI